MHTPILCLLLFALWTVLIVVAVGAVRVRRVLTGQQGAGSFPSGVPHGGDRYWRANRAHANCCENLPIFGAIVLAGESVGMTGSAWTMPAVIVICARVVQSTVHIASNDDRVVNLRFAAFLTQLGCFAWMAAQVLLR